MTIEQQIKEFFVVNQATGKAILKAKAKELWDVDEVLAHRYSQFARRGEECLADVLCFELGYAVETATGKALHEIFAAEAPEGAREFVFTENETGVTYSFR